MPVCIAGMARSGTSLCTRILNLCGVYLGDERDLLPPAPDNPDGFWENIRFVSVNEELLGLYGGAWDCPPTIPLDDRSERFARLRAKAEATLETFADREPWGWKDPRNSLTLPFWRHYFPEMKVVICLRNPLEVARSLYKRSWYSTQLSLTLWYVYNRRLMDAIPPGQRIITHYDAYFDDPEREMRRVLDFLALPVADDRIAAACTAVAHGLRHHRFTTQHMRDAGVTPAVLDLYTAMCDAAGDIATASPQPSGHRRGAPTTETAIGQADAGVGRLDRAAMELLVLRDEIRSLKAVIDAAKEEREQLRTWGHGLEQQLTKLGEEYERRGAYMSEMEAHLVARDASIAEAGRYTAELEALIPAKEAYIARLEADIADRQRYMATLEGVIPPKDAYIARLEALIPPKDDYIARLEAAVAGQRQYIADLEADIPLKEAYIARLEEAMAAKNLPLAGFESDPPPQEDSIGRCEAAISAPPIDGGG